MALKLHLRVEIEGEAGPAARPELAAVLRLVARRTLQSGVGHDQVDKVFADRRSLTSGAHEDLDLAGGLQDGFGRWIDFEQLRAIWLTADAANGADLLVGGGSFTAPFAAANDAIRVRPGGALLLLAPSADDWPVASPADDLRVTNAGGGAATYDLILIGATAPDLDFSVEGNPLIVLFL